MAADVFADNFRFAAQIENSGGVNSTSAGEVALVFLQKRRERKQSLDFDPNTSRRIDRWKILSNRGDALFAADSATARNRSVSFRGTQFHLHVFCELDRDDVFAITRLRRARELIDLVRCSHDSFRDQKTSREFFVVTGRAHCRRKSLAADSNFERFLDGEIVVMILERAVCLSSDDLTRTNAVRLLFHVLVTPL